MINCRILFLTGPINSGKSTVGLLLSQKIKDAFYLDGDQVVAKEDLTHEQWIVATIMTATLKACELAHEGRFPIVAFPLRDRDWKVINGLCEHAGVRPICITLDPGQDIALSDRAGRKLTAPEKERIQKMYEEGYQNRSFSELTVKNSSESPEETCVQIQTYLENQGFND